MGLFRSVIRQTSGGGSGGGGGGAPTGPAGGDLAGTYPNPTIADRDYRPSARCATTANITLSGEQTIDGILTAASRVLVKDQTTGADNGIYVTAPGAWTRATDFDVSAEVSPGAIVPVEGGGTVNGGRVFLLSTTGTITLGTTALTFVRVDTGLAPSTADYLVGTADTGLSGEIVVGTTPGGELGGTWASPTVDASHSGSTHAAVQAAAEATAAADATTKVNAGVEQAVRFAVFNKTSADGNAELFRTDVRMGGDVRITTDTAYQSWRPRVSPDGTRIVFNRRTVASGGTSTNYDQNHALVSIWVMDFDGGNLLQIVAVGATGAGASQGTPSWHPNGLDIVFFGGAAPTALYTIQVDGTNQTALTTTGPTNGRTDPQFSPDATSIAFAADFDIWTVPYPAGGAATALTTDGNNTPIANYDPCWSPDGQNISYLTKGSDGPPALFGVRKMTKAGASQVYLVAATSIAGPPIWGLDGYVYFHGIVPGTDTLFQLWRVQSDGSGVSAERLTAVSATVQRCYVDVWAERAVLLAADAYATVKAAEAYGLSVAYTNAHITQGAAAHAASAVGFTPNGSIAATNVQTAIQEVRDDAAAAVSDVAYNATTWNAVVDVAPSKNAVRDKFEALDTIAAGVRTAPNTGTPGQVGIDVTLSGGIAGGDTLTGGTAAGEDLTLASTVHATRGTIFVRDIVELLSEDKTNTTDTPVIVMEIPNTRTITLNNATANQPGNQFQVLRAIPVIVYDLDANVFGSLSFFNAGPTLKNVTTEVRTISLALIYGSQPIYQADGAAVTFGAHFGFFDSPASSVINAGTGTVTAATSLESRYTVNTSTTVTTRKGMFFRDATGAGTMTTQIGIDIPALAKGATNIGVRNASTTVYTPLANTAITAVSGTIRIDASIVTLTANASYTLTSAPTVADGQDGQVLRIINVDTVDTITIQDQGTLASSNLRLSATTIALGPRDSITLVYSSTIGDWVQIGQVNVI